MKHSHSGGLLGARVTSEKVGGHKPRHVLRVHSLNPLTQRKASGAAGPGNRRPSRSPHHRECQFHCDSLGIGVMCAWFCGQVLAVGTIQARPAGVSGQKWGSFLPLTAPGAHQLYCTYTGSLAYRELGVEPTALLDGQSRDVSTHSVWGAARTLTPVWFSSSHNDCSASWPVQAAASFLLGLLLLPPPV